MAKSLTLIPAYGRDYKSKVAVLADWEAGKDFQSAISGQYVGIGEKRYLVEDEGITELSFGYAGKTKQFILKLV